MPSKQEYKDAMNGLTRDQRIPLLYLQGLIEAKARPVETIKPDNQDWIKERFNKIETRLTAIEDLKKTLNKTIKDQRKEIDGKITSNEAILRKLNEAMDGIAPLIKDVQELRKKLIKEVGQLQA